MDREQVLVRLGLERARSARAAMDVIIDAIGRFGQGGSGHDPSGPRRPYWNGFLIYDSGSAWVLEASGRDGAAEEVRSVRSRATLVSFRLCSVRSAYQWRSWWWGCGCVV